MNKPTIFFSHSTKDETAMNRLRELFVEKTGCTIDVFLSSDGQSIRFGRNWVSEIEKALERASLMIVFLSANSLKSNWIHFESGFAYSKGIRVIPVGILGVTIDAIKPPLRLLQGFNISSEDGLNNLIAIVNEEFEFTHRLSFIDEDYHDFTSRAGNRARNFFGINSSLVEDVVVYLPNESDNEDLGKTLENISSYLDLKDVEHVFGKTAAWGQLRVEFTGVSVYKYSGRVKFSLDAEIAETTIPIVNSIALRLRSDGMKGDIIIEIEFAETVALIGESHKITGRLRETPIKQIAPDSYVFDNVEFEFDRLSFLGGSGDVEEVSGQILRLDFRSRELKTSVIGDLIDLLFDKRVLVITNNF